MNGEKVDSTVYIDLDKPRRFKFSLGLMARLERVLGKEEYKKINWSALSLSDVILVLHTAFTIDDPELTIDELEAMIDFESYEGIVSSVVKSMESAFPEKKTKRKKKKTTTAAAEK